MMILCIWYNLAGSPGHLVDGWAVLPIFYPPCVG